MDHTKMLNLILIESDQALKDVLNLIKKDKKAIKLKDQNLEFYDYIYSTYEKKLEKILTKYKLDYDDLAEILMNIIEKEKI